jgi:hypothetical protein
MCVSYGEFCSLLAKTMCELEKVFNLDDHIL